jgi:DnaJ family protein C protein 2
LKALEAFAAMNSANGGDDLSIGDEEEDPFLLSLDPKEWKKQDHYAVLGLSHLRYKATPQQIRVAHRKKVLKHHPDKKAGSGDSNDDAFFKCISKAFEVLINPERKAQFDSVDPHYVSLEEDAPTVGTYPKNAPPEKFFKIFGPIFEREARFYKGPIEEVPMIGGIDDPKEKVEEFYDFWYKFESWRSFEYLDKEVNEGSDNRDDKRYTEKKNKSERARRKKEDNARLRGLVDTCLAVDPRIKRIKAEEKEERERKKRARVNGVSVAELQKKEEEEKKKQEEERRRLEEEEKSKADAKKTKAAAANAAKKARRAARAAEEAAGGK